MVVDEDAVLNGVMHGLFGIERAWRTMHVTSL